MGIQEQSAATREAIDERSPRLRVAVETTDPVVLIIDHNHDNIRSTLRRSRWLSRSSYLAAKQTNRTQNESRNESGNAANRVVFLTATVPLRSLRIDFLNAAQGRLAFRSLRSGNPVDCTEQNPLGH